MRDEPLDWDAFVSTVHPIRIAAVEAMQWIDEPFSAVDLDRMHGNDSPGVSAISYHLRALAFDLPVLRLYGEETIRGAKRKLYYFRKRTPASRRKKQAA